MKKLISILLCVLLAFSLISCNTQKNEQKNEKTSSTSQKEEAKKTGEKPAEENKEETAPSTGKMEDGAYDKLASYIKQNGEKDENGDYEVFRYAEKTAFSMALDKDGKIFWSFLFLDDTGSSFSTIELNKTSNLHNASFIDVAAETDTTITSIASIDALTYSKDNNKLIGYQSSIGEEGTSLLEEISTMSVALLFTGAKSVLDDANMTFASLGFVAY